MRTAENSFDLLCRLVEDGYAGEDRSPKSAYAAMRQILCEEPLYLFSRAKYDAALAFAHVNTLNYFSQEYPPTFTVCDHAGAVSIIDLWIDRERQLMRTTSMVVINGAETDDVIEWGVITALIHDNGVDANGCRAWVVEPEEGRFSGGTCLVTKKGVKLLTAIRGVRAPLERTLLEDCARSVTTALDEINYTFKPRTVVVTQEPTNAKIRNTVWTKKKRLPKAVQRKTHIILDPDDVVTLKEAARTTPGVARTSPRPHKRRAHKRVLRAARYGENIGKVITVGEIEVNVKPGETIRTPQRIYHVVSVGGKTDALRDS